MIRRFCRRFHREESAQVSFLAVGGAVCFIGLLSMIINSDDIVTERIYMQDVADTVTVSAASWTARGLNMISFVNVLNSKLISTAVLLNATADAIPAIKAVGNIQKAIFNGCTGVPFVGVFCAAMYAIVSVQVEVLGALDTVFGKMADNLSRCGGGKKGALWPVMNGLNTAARGVKESFTAIGMVESVAMAKAVGADMGFVFNGNMVGVGDSNFRNAVSLPVEPGGFAAFCPFVKNGGSGYKMAGYSCGEGPFKLGKERINKFIMTPFFNLFANPIFKGMAAAHFQKIGCTNDPEDEDNTIEVQFRSISECRQYGGQLEWAQMVSETRPTTEANLGVADFAPWKPLNAGEERKLGDEADISGLGDLSLPGVNTDPGSVAGNVKPTGPRYNLLDASTENNLRSSKFNCLNQQIPLYRAPFSWDIAIPGELGCGATLTPTECRAINQWGEFTYYTDQGNTASTPNAVGGYYIRVAKREETAATDEDPATYVYMVETVSLVSAGSKELDQDEFKDYLSKNGQDGNSAEAKQGSESCQKPDPYVLATGTTQSEKDEFQNKLRFIGVVYRQLDDADEKPFWSGFYSTPPETLIAYGQAQVYNHLAEDTFTQDWRVRMEQTSLLEDVFKKMGLSGPIGGNEGFIGTINNH